MDYFYTKENILGSLVAAEDYIDWETGTCSFDCDSFRAALMLVNECPAEYEWPDTPGEHRSLDKRKLDGLQMLSIEPVCDFDGKLYLESERFPDGMGGMMYGFGERLSYIGYPTEDGSAGSYFALRGNTAVMSSTCKNKEAAWEFLRESFLPRCDQSLEELLSDKSERFGTIPYTFWNGGFPSTAPILRSCGSTRRPSTPMNCWPGWKAPARNSSVRCRRRTPSGCWTFTIR